METKELNFRGFKANGFLMLAMHLLLISGIIICCFMQMTTPFFILGGVLLLIWFFYLVVICNWNLMKRVSWSFSGNIKELSKRQDSFG